MEGGGRRWEKVEGGGRKWKKAEESGRKREGAVRIAYLFVSRSHGPKKREEKKTNKQVKTKQSE